jgi:hypothetical protein
MLAVGQFLVFFQDRVQDAVDEGGALLGGELLGELDGFVDDDLGGGEGVGELPDGEADEVSVDGGLASWGPLGGEALDPGVDAVALGPGSSGHFDGLAAGFVVFGGVGGDAVGGFGGLLLLGVPEEEDLHGQFADFSPF